MELYILLIGIALLAIILLIIAIVLIKKSNKNKPLSPKKREKEMSPPIPPIQFEELMAIVKDKNSTSKELLNALKLFSKHFKIDEKKAKHYFIFFSRLLSHRNVNKEIFDYYHKKIKKENKKFIKELDRIESTILKLI